MKPFRNIDDSLKSRRRKAQEEKELLDELKDKTEFEKGDFPALIVAALITILPVVLIILAAYYFITMFFFS